MMMVMMVMMHKTDRQVLNTDEVVPIPCIKFH